MINNVNNFYSITIMLLSIISSHLNAEFIWSYFNRRPILYDVRKGPKVFLPLVKSFRLRLHSVHFKGIILLSNLPSSMKNSQTSNSNGKVWETFIIHVPCVVETRFLSFKFFYYAYFLSTYFFIAKF